MRMERTEKYKYTLITLLLFLWVTACGQTPNTDYETEAELVTESVTKHKNSTVRSLDQGAEQIQHSQIITAYLSEEITCKDEVVPIQCADDLSLLTDMKYAGGAYAYLDGGVYYRRYHEDSFAETGEPVPRTKKEIVFMDETGVETVLFTDTGYGNIFLVNNRFYLTEIKADETTDTGTAGIGTLAENYLYSVDMQGNDRIDYGCGSIFAIDPERHILMIQMYEQSGQHYYAMNAETGEKKLILSDRDYDINVGIYRNGLLYYEKKLRDEPAVSRLCTVSLDGEQKELLALTSENNQNPSDGFDSILQIEADEERVYCIFGGYGGREQQFQNGALISIRLDGTDYKAVEATGDCFCLAHDSGNPLIYFPRYAFSFEVDSYPEYDTTVWDVNANLCRISDLPESLVRSAAQTHRYHPAQGVLCVRNIYGDTPVTDIYAVPGGSGQFVKVVQNLEKTVASRKQEEGNLYYQDLYYADGFLYFTMEYAVYGDGIDWLHYTYRRLSTSIFRLKIGESEAQLLYSY